MDNIILENISTKDINFMEEWNTPKAFCETMFPDFDSPALYEQDKFGNIRLYQEPFLSDESLIDFELTAKYHKLNKKQEFQLRKNVGDLYCFGARKYGKTLCVEKLDLLVDLTHDDSIKGAFSSVDLIHINEVLDDVKNAFQNHPILSLWENSIKGAPNYKFQLKNNYNLQSVNFNVGSKNPGRQWYGKHVKRVYIEENSLETEEVYKKRKDALSEFGAVMRCSGMTNFTAYSPAGKAFNAIENRKNIINLPQYVNPMWDEKEKEDRLEHYGGEDSIGYRVFVKGEIVTDGVAVFDMDRVREACYVLEARPPKTTRQIKRFEITKERFSLFKNFIVIERPINAERIFINSDVGKKVNEIIIHSEIGNKYDYLYNIVLYNLTVLEKWEIYKYIIEKLQANVIGFDCGDGEGRALYSMAEREYSKENLVYYDGSMKINVDFTYDENKNIIMENGEPVYRQEYMSEFSVQRLMNLLYGGRMIIPCFEEGTEILTKEGWKDFRDIKETEAVLTLDNDSDNVFYKEINNKVVNNFDGNLISYKVPTFSFSVTPDHQMLIKTRRGKIKYKNAIDLKPGDNIRRYLGNWIGDAISDFKVSENITYPIIPWLKFLGWYLSEGCIYKHRTGKSYNYKISLAQSKLEGREEIEEILKELKLNFYKNSTSFEIYNKVIFNWLKNNCYDIHKNSKIKIKSIYNCYNKEVPDFIRFLDKKLIFHFLEAYIKGDGHVYKNKWKNIYCYSTSKKLADNIQELGLKCNYIVNIKYMKPSSSYFKKENRTINSNGGYSIRFKQFKSRYTQLKADQITQKYYKGRVYCVTVEPHHNIYVRHCGATFWTGNCDYKFDAQFSVVMSMISGTRTKYRCVSESGDHLFDAHKVFSISQWLKKDFNQTPKIKKEIPIGVVGMINI